MTFHDNKSQSLNLEGTKCNVTNAESAQRSNDDEHKRHTLNNYKELLLIVIKEGRLWLFYRSSLQLLEFLVWINNCYNYIRCYVNLIIASKKIFPLRVRTFTYIS